jgi:uncharacterized protein YkwD
LRDPLRFIRYVLLVACAAAILLPAQAAAGNLSAVGTDRLRAAETRLLKDVNRIRVRNGRKPLRLDRRTSQVARARSSDMATKRYFAHIEPDGDDARRILRRRDIHATSVTENIGQTFGLTLREGANRMAKWWYRSPPHRLQMLARDSNYIGIGIARRGSRFTYTAIFTRSRDKTDPHVVIDDATLSDDGTQVTIDWHGVDPRLATGTAGIRSYDLEHFTPLGGWGPVGGDPRRSKRSFWTSGTGDRHLRIRAVDTAGNVGPWAYTRIGTPDHLPRWASRPPSRDLL